MNFGSRGGRFQCTKNLVYIETYLVQSGQQRGQWLERWGVCLELEQWQHQQQQRVPSCALVFSQIHNAAYGKASRLHLVNLRANSWILCLDSRTCYQM